MLCEATSGFRGLFSNSPQICLKYLANRNVEMPVVKHAGERIQLLLRLTGDVDGYWREGWWCFGVCCFHGG